MARVVIAGGGTGGHLSPGIAVAERLREHGPRVSVDFVCSARALDAHMLHAAALDYHPLTCESFPYRPGLRSLLSGGKLLVAVHRARRLLRRLRPQVVLGVGGYVSVPVVWAAHQLGLPIALHVLDAQPDRANLFLSRWADWITLAFAQAQERFAGRDTQVTGCPVRREILTVSRAQGLDQLGLAPDLATLLVMGGSHGARRINQAVVGALPQWLASLPVQVVHLIGERDYEETVAATATAAAVHGRYLPLAFADRIGRLLAVADLVVARAGASSLAEAVVRRLPQILVPYPHAGAHQLANAQAVAEAGAAVILLDSDCTEAALGALVAELTRDQARRRQLAQAAEGYARPQAAEQIAEGVLRLAH